MKILISNRIQIILVDETINTTLNLILGNLIALDGRITSKKSTTRVKQLRTTREIQATAVNIKTKNLNIIFTATHLNIL